MPARSEAQRRFLYARFGAAWAKRHHFDNEGPLPARKGAPVAQPKLGSGARFKRLEAKLAGRPGVTNPGALAAYIGRKKYGKKRFQKLSAKGRGKGGAHKMAGGHMMADSQMRQHMGGGGS